MMKLLFMLLVAGASCSIACAQDDYGPQVGEPQVYKTVGGKPLHVWISQPSDRAAQHPAIVFFHGGGWTAGTVTQFNVQTKELAARGMVVVDVEYRLIAKAPSTESPEICLEDAKSAMRWVRSHAKELRVDPDKIVASGGSAGGYLAAAVALVPGWNDPADNLDVSPKPLKYSPVEFLSRGTPPTIIEGGGADKLVKPEELQNFKAKCDAVGATCVLNMYPGQGHGFANKQPYTTLTLNDVLHFLIGLGYLPRNTPDVPASPPLPN
jgi:acetyl esterase